MKTVCRRLHRGDDLLLSIRTLCECEKIDAAVVLSVVGCVSRAVLRDAGGVNLRSVDEPNPDAMLAWLEADALRRINGQTLTALAVNIEAEGGAECLAICLGRHPLMCAEERIA